MSEYSQEKKDLLDKGYGIINLRYVTLTALVLLGFIAAVAANAFIPLVSGIILAILVLTYNTAALGYLKRKENLLRSHQILRLSFLLLFLDVLVITVIVYISGGILSPFTFVYLIFPVIMIMLAPDKTYFALSITLFIILVYESLLTLQYYEIIPTFFVIEQGKAVYQDKNLLLYYRFIFPVAIFAMLFCASDLAKRLIKDRNAALEQEKIN